MKKLHQFFVELSVNPSLANTYNAGVTLEQTYASRVLALTAFGIERVLAENVAHLGQDQLKSFLAKDIAESDNNWTEYYAHDGITGNTNNTTNHLSAMNYTKRV